MNKKLDNAFIQKYLNGILSHATHRYRSWDYCFNAFSEQEDLKNLPLHLAFYLASWGMYRGSSGLLQKNHSVHNKAVEIINSEKYKNLRCSEANEMNRGLIPLLMNIKKDLANHYRSIPFTKDEEEKYISPTDTLISKILLGTLGCVPAFDRYFNDGLRIENAKTINFDENSLNEIFDFIDNNKSDIIQFQKVIKQKTNSYYPVMKIIDMYFWQIGFDNR